jgi:cytochrome P450
VTAILAGEPLDERLDALLAGRPDALLEPFALYRELRERGRAHVQGQGQGQVILVTHYEDVKLVVRDAERFSNLALVAGPRIDEARTQMADNELVAFDDVTAFCANFPSRADGAQHIRLRSAAHRAFTPGRIAAMEQPIRELLDRLLAPLSTDEPIDFIEKVAFRLPLLVVADLLGVPHEDAEMIHRWSIALGASTGATVGEPFLAAQGSLEEFRGYVDLLIERSRERTGTDLVSLMLGADLTHDELAALFVQILFAGHETTTTLISAGLVELLGAPDQWRALGREPTLAPNAVEELLRLVSPSQFISRLAVVDTKFGDTHVREGTTVLAVLAAANRDPEVFPEPDRLDLRRPDLAKQLAFGFGPHFCLGGPLARLEARIVFEELSRRYPDASLASDKLEWTGSAMLRRLVDLLVRLGTRRP